MQTNGGGKSTHIPLPTPLNPFYSPSHRDVDGVDADLRRKIAEHLPPVEDGQDTVASVTAVGCTDAAERGGERRSSAEVSLPPATLARALPHIRRHLPPGETGGMLALLRGGGLVFPDKPSNAPPLKQGEVRCQCCCCYCDGIM